ncbi:GAF domain-containing SpoIIE family protein phosphatase [Nocardioides sp.]|uniref:GAF domain-containing SpoIIE family protein phosphatase n=1 Tax=Nocardioides sp. TaxID=35761 RepID=UPI002EDBAA27
MESVGAAGADPSFDRYARMVCRTLGAPIALVSLVDGDRQVFPGAWGLPPELDAARETPLSHSLCAHVVADGAPLVVADLCAHPELQRHPAVADLGVRAYAGWPLVDHTGAVVGSLCALDREPRQWTCADLELLEDLASACATHLSERAARAAEADLGHRSRVLLALSEGLSATRTMADVAQAVERTALAQLGCARAGMWVCTDDATSRTGQPEQVLRFVTSPSSRWESALRNAHLPLDDSNPLGLSIVLRDHQHYRGRDEQNRRYPHLDTTRQVGEARSFVPLLGRTRALGALALVWDHVRDISEEDRVTIDALASYTAQAVQRALLLQERLDALVTLQSSLLPRLPEPESLELAARYRPAASRDQVGGDWYDAVVMPSGATSLMVGDVVGHNIGAAAIMGQLRNMLRAIAWAVDDAPSRNVARLDQAMQDLTVDGMASLVYARIEQTDEQRSRSERTLRWTNAGHPPPLVVAPEGTARLLEHDTADLMLGVLPDAERTDNRTTIEAGSVLLLYTDGLVERRREDLTDGLDRLRTAASAHHGLPMADFVDAVLGDLVPDRLEDDVAVLAVRFHDQQVP